MDPSSAHHHQEMGSQTLESMLVCTKTQQEKKPRPQQEQALKCPRCDSTNTKFCYYNNYSLSQPRYFCKSCRRYWTKGGTLRNVPVGGGCRKNKRSSSSSSSSSSSKRSQDQPLITTPLSTLPTFTYDSNDLSLAFARLHNHNPPSGQLGFDAHDLSILGNTNNPHCDVLGTLGINTSAAATPGFLHALRSGFVEASNDVNDLCYGIGDGHMGQLENVGLVGSASEEISTTMPYEDLSSGAATTAVTVTTMKQEQYCNDRGGENRVLWGYPWQHGGDGNMGDILDSGRESWNGLGSSWHGLLNSPLM